MTNIPIAEAKNRLSELITRVEAGEDIAMTRRGKLVARLVAVDVPDAGARRSHVEEAFRQLSLLRRSLSLEGGIKEVAREGLD